MKPPSSSVIIKQIISDNISFEHSYLLTIRVLNICTFWTILLRTYVPFEHSSLLNTCDSNKWASNKWASNTCASNIRTSVEPYIGKYSDNKSLNSCGYMLIFWKKTTMIFCVLSVGNIILQNIGKTLGLQVLVCEYSRFDSIRESFETEKADSQTTNFHIPNTRPF